MKYNTKKMTTQERILRLNRELARKLWGAYHPTPDVPHPYSAKMITGEPGMSESRII